MWTRYGVTPSLLNRPRRGATPPPFDPSGRFLQCRRDGVRVRGLRGAFRGDRRLRSDARENASFEMRVVALPVGERERRKIAAVRVQLADDAARDLVRGPEGDAAIDQVISDFRGEEQTRRR